MKLQGETLVPPVSLVLNKNIQHASRIYIFGWGWGFPLSRYGSLHQQITFVRQLWRQTWWVWGFYQRLHSAEVMEDGEAKVILIISTRRLGVTYTRRSLGGRCLVYRSPGLSQCQRKRRYLHTCSRQQDFVFQKFFQWEFGPEEPRERSEVRRRDAEGTFCRLGKVQS